MRFPIKIYVENNGFAKSVVFNIKYKLVLYFKVLYKFCTNKFL